MKISERKERLRRRGIVPVAQREVRADAASGSGSGPVPARKGTTATFTAGARQGSRGSRGSQGSRAAAKGGAKGASARPRRQVSPTYQMTIGALYTLFAPLLFVFYLAQAHNPKSKGQPLALDLVMAALFFLFGVWQLSSGLRARRRRAAEKAGAATPAAVAPVKRSRLLKGSP